MKVPDEQADNTYPGLHVAYIDEVEERDVDKVQKVFYSVLVKALDNHDQFFKMELPLLKVADQDLSLGGIHGKKEI
ncbi:hypothetical protein E2562_007051 [Oryza meyeriana var. granulata]|uniref:Uncharacterized protein n=1 Tax=Oryza meyeriana var. granulata TaxID=110450 RepID=A0A6G1F4R1_9ORYZ|nr:hypothetical protein E2562_007051 [Oryza meyeriana var. granulata]